MHGCRVPSGPRSYQILAEFVFQGVNRVVGVQSRILEIRGMEVPQGGFQNHASMAELDGGDGIIFGCATSMGSGSAMVKAFLDRTALVGTAMERQDRSWLYQLGFSKWLSTLMQLTVLAMERGFGSVSAISPAIMGAAARAVI